MGFGWLLRRISALLLAGGAGLLVIVLPPLHGPGPYVASPIGVLRLALIVGAIVLGVAGLELHGLMVAPAAWRRLGAVSYPLYILHMPLLSLLVNRPLQGVRLGGWELYLLFAALLLAIYGFAVAATWLFDQPAQRWLRRFRA